MRTRVLLVLALLTLSACAATPRDGAELSVSQQSGAQPAQDDGLSSAERPEWANEGARLRAEKGLRRAELARGEGPGEAANAGNLGDFAYQSQSVTLDKDGPVTLRFGPLDSNFDYPRSPSSLSYNFPSDISFQLAPSASPPAGIEVVGGERYWTVTWTVTGLTQPYRQFSAWIY